MVYYSIILIMSHYGIELLGYYKLLFDEAQNI